MEVREFEVAVLRCPFQYLDIYPIPVYYIYIPVWGITSIAYIRRYRYEFNK